MNDRFECYQVELPFHKTFLKYQQYLKHQNKLDNFLRVVWTESEENEDSSSSAAQGAREDGHFIHKLLPVSLTRLALLSVSWMSKLDDKISLTALTIPGSHDSGTSNGPRNDLLATICRSSIITQSWSITEQLHRGIRFLDIRCNNNNGNFGIQHGVFDIIGCNFASVLEECSRFLADSPSETIIMSVKEEGKSRGSISFVDAFRKQYVEGFPWYKDHDLPTLGAARGKIVLLSRFGSFDFGFHLNVKDNTWTSDQHREQVYHIQDLYKVDRQCHNKVRQIVDFVHLARAGCSDHLFVNFVSGCNTPESVASTAKKINTRILSILPPHGGRNGIMIMDFPPFELIMKLIHTNF
jgi:1-phosphatidylinositol phosphodiesterase